jgi:hypothetical protein
MGGMVVDALLSVRAKVGSVTFKLLSAFVMR